MKTAHRSLAMAASFLLGLMFSPFGVSDTNKWPAPRTTIHIGMPDTAPSGIAWSQALREAAEAWNAATTFEFIVATDYRNPCAGNDGRNGHDFAFTVCGRDFNDNTLAVTLTYYENTGLGVNYIYESDVVYNQHDNFDIYDGPSRIGNPDFRRVALHELGHVLGLDHQPHNSQAIMAPNIGHLFTLQARDITAANSLYASAPAHCQLRPLRFGQRHESLNANDCRVFELMSGGDDDSFVDAYQLELTEPATVSILMESGSLDSVLILADHELGILEIDDDGAAADNCDAMIRRHLSAGSYTILSNSYTAATECGNNQGPYRLTLSYENSPLRTLSGKASFQGGDSNARFQGGVTLNSGQSYTNRVTPTQRFDVQARIEIDPLHHNKPGFLVVAAQLADGHILVKNPAGDFVDYQPDLALIPIYRSKELGVVENIAVLSDTRAVELGIQEIVVDFLVGYGLNENPDELYFHQEPINLHVAP